MSNEKTLNLSEIEILEIFCKIEDACAALYRFFSKLYEENSQASTLWEKTAQEEDNHAEQFRFACRLRGSGMSGLDIDMHQATMTLSKIQSIYDGVQKTRPALKEALRFAIKLEHTMASTHMHAIAQFSDKSLERLFKSMMMQDKLHIEKLEEAFQSMIEQKTS